MSVSRLIGEIRILHRVLEPADFRSALGAMVAQAPQILVRRNLTPLDKAMSRDVKINFRGQILTIPAGSIDRQLASRNDNATFGAVREMFGSDVYLRAFKPMPDMDTVIDLGSNRGFFSLIATKILKARRVIAVEPTADYNAAFAYIAGANAIPDGSVTRINKFMGATDDDKMISLEKLFADCKVDRVDFLKCDIEGSEYATFAGNPDLVKRIANLAMEVHPWCGSTTKLVEFLTSTGLTVMTTDQHGHIVPTDKALYVYASRQGQLMPPFFAEGVKAQSPYR